jgi:hypothetical protein
VERRDLPLLRVLAAATDDDLRAGSLHVGFSDVGDRFRLDLEDLEIHDGMPAFVDAGYVDFNVQ